MSGKGPNAPSSGAANFYDAVGLYNDCVAFLPEIEAVISKLEASLFELVQVKAKAPSLGKLKYSTIVSATRRLWLHKGLVELLVPDTKAFWINEK